MTKKLFLYLAMAVISLTACKDENGNSFFVPKRIDPPSVEDRVAVSKQENLGRSSWQKPSLIVDQLGDVNGKTIADIGSGTGYFTFHLAYLNANVIAVDIDQEMLKYIDTSKMKLPAELIPHVTTRLAQEDDPLLRDNEIDHALIINTIGYISNTREYLARVKPAIKAGGSLVIVDFKLNAPYLPNAPSPEYLADPDVIQDALIKDGYKNVIINDTSLAYQYIITADAR